MAPVPVMDNVVSPHCGLTKGGKLSFLRLKTSDCFSGTTIDFTTLDRAIAKVDSKLEIIVRLYINDGKNQNYLPSFVRNASDYKKQTNDLVHWGSPTVQKTMLSLFGKLAAHLSKAPRVMLLQWGIGYWSEFHVHGVDLKIGGNWPSADYVDKLADTLQANAGDLLMSVSVGVGDMARPISDKFRTNTRFGLFYDTFLQNNGDAEPAYITTLYKNANWEGRAKKCIMGGEFANYTPALSSDLLKKAQKYIDRRHMSYLLPNGTSKIMESSSSHLQTLSGSMGYGLKLAKKSSTTIAVTNTGVAPVFYDMYVYIEGEKLPTSLKGLQRGETREIKGVLTGTPVIRGPKYATDVPYTM